MNYNLEQVYDEQIAPLMKQIIDICKENQLPMLASFQYKQTGTESDNCTTYLHFPERPASNRLQSAHQLIYNGFIAYAVRKAET